MSMDGSGVKEPAKAAIGLILPPRLESILLD
jgi:hypothetical protein